MRVEFCDAWEAMKQSSSATSALPTRSTYSFSSSCAAVTSAKWFRRMESSASVESNRAKRSGVGNPRALGYILAAGPSGSAQM